MTSNAKAAGRFGKQDFRYVAAEDVYICPAGQRLAYFFTTEDKGLVLRRYRTNACQSCAIKHGCTTSKETRLSQRRSRQAWQGKVCFGSGSIPSTKPDIRRSRPPI